uniref:Choloylglycine hydrolase/NAAA C-terminal domain-containing protein n=1 Tax=Aureoumbra lagunensis TaxID=44058 RepID=A0A7S3NMN0_9STRA|mmetsp:Transcript_7883/g.11975  ORF Transcript_7883/g.11975 Transcript_7883/m.11975 type:complete len:350 (-) Transcript_7883:42-1091(-)
MLLILACSLFTFVAGCSNFIMENDPYMISVRTMDLGFGAFDFMVVKKGKTGNLYGYVSTVFGLPKIPLKRFVAGGLSEAGLTCDQQTLLNSSYPSTAELTADRIVSTDSFCGEVLANYSNVTQLKVALESNALAIAAGLVTETHFVVRDNNGESLIIESPIDGTTGAGILSLYIDKNDHGTTGYGIFTNEPPFPWHLQYVQQYKWMNSLERSAAPWPGTWYPHHRFLRIHLIKSAMSKPASYEIAIAQAIHVLNSITVPMGNQYGTESGKGEGAGDHTLYATIYDRLNLILYFRTERNQNFQKIDLPSLLQRAESLHSRETLTMPIVSNDYSTFPFYNDVTSAFDTTLL